MSAVRPSIQFPGHRAIVAAACGVLLLAAGSARAADDDVAPAARAQLETDLKDARERLDDAARDVAELTRKLYGDEPHDVLRFVGRPPRGSMLGVNIDSDDAKGQGVRIVGVSPGGPAAQAGLKAGDVIVAVDGKSLAAAGEASEQLAEHMRATDPGTTVNVEYVRGGQRQTAKVKTSKAEPAFARMLRDREALPALRGEAPVWEQFAVPPFDVFFDAGHAFRSLELVSVTPKLGQYFGTDKGLLVVRAPASSQYGLEEGDVLLAIENRVPESPGHAFRILRSYQPGEELKLQVLRSRKRIDVVAEIPEEASAPPGAPALRVPPPQRMPLTPTPPVPPAGDST
jgi:membrane-associated protease RseP (regulator of RpoE activity)